MTLYFGDFTREKAIFEQSKPRTIRAYCAKVDLIEAIARVLEKNKQQKLGEKLYHQSH